MEQKELLFSKNNVAILVLALLLLFISTLIEHPFMVEDGDGSHFNSKFAASLLKEIAFALLIALVISIGIEYRARKSDLLAAEAMRKRIAHDVFKGVFEADLPPPYVEAVMRRNLRVQLIRPFMRIHDVFSRTAAAGRGALKCERRMVYGLRNVSGRDETFQLKCHISVDLWDLVDQTCVTSVTITRKDGSQETRDPQAGRSVEQDLERVNYEWPLKLSAGEEVTVELKMTFFKEEVDSEVWTAAYATMKLHYSTRFADAPARFGVAAQAAAPLQQQTRDVAGGSWEIEGPVLIDNSITAWWDARDGAGTPKPV